VYEPNAILEVLHRHSLVVAVMPVPAGAVVLDCGAHVGVYTRRALNEGAAKVIAIEPVPQTVECLRRTFRREIAEGRVVVYQKGVRV
jgi:predicted RNA methylase